MKFLNSTYDNYFICLSNFIPTSCTVYIFPALAPEITEPPSNEATVDGRIVTMTCRVFGAPKPEVKWLHNNKELTGGRYTVLDNGDLEIR